jgi:hypothetical protein
MNIQKLKPKNNGHPAIEAVQLTEDSDWDAIADWCKGRYVREECDDTLFSSYIQFTGYDEDEYVATEGDWIFKGEGYIVYNRKYVETYYEKV